MKLFFIYLVAALLSCESWNQAQAAQTASARAGDPFADSSAQENPSLPGDPFAETTDPSPASLTGDPFSEKSTHWNQSNAAKLKQSKDTFLYKGWLESRNQFWLRNKRPFSTRQRLWFEGEGAFTGETVSGNAAVQRRAPRFFLSGSLDFDPAAADLSTDHNRLSAILHEAYLTVEGKTVDLLIGKKMVRWGTGDGINPLDLINPRDHRDPLASGRADNRLAVPLIQGIISLPASDPVQELTLETVAVPVAQITRLNAAGAAWEPAALQALRSLEQQELLVLASQKKPERWFEDGSYGLRLTATIGGWDLGLTGYSGIKNDPVLTGQFETDNRLCITPVHPHINAFGLSFATGTHRTTLRGELAVKPHYPIQKEGSLIPGYSRRTLVEGVIGFDRTFGLNRYLNLHYFAEFIQKNKETARRHYSHGLTFECSDLFFNDDVKLGVSGVVGLSGQGWAIQPYGEYHIDDDWLLAFSFFLFHGDENEKYGQFADRDFVSLRLRYSF